MQGAVVYNNYGNKSNGELLLGYGFVLQNNPADFFYIGVGLSQGSGPERDGSMGDPAGGTSGVGSTAAVQRRVLLAGLGLATDHFIKRSDPVPRALISTAAVSVLPACYAVQLAAAAAVQRRPVLTASIEENAERNLCPGADSNRGVSSSAPSEERHNGLSRLEETPTTRTGKEAAQGEEHAAATYRFATQGQGQRDGLPAVNAAEPSGLDTGRHDDVPSARQPKGTDVKGLDRRIPAAVESQFEVPRGPEPAEARDWMREFVARGAGFPCPPAVLLEVGPCP
jgi:hypothetical protein